MHENSPAQTRPPLEFKRHVKGFPVKPVVVWANGGRRGEGWGKQEYAAILSQHEMLRLLVSSSILEVRPFGRSDGGGQLRVLWLHHWWILRRRAWRMLVHTLKPLYHSKLMMASRAAHCMWRWRTITWPHVTVSSLFNAEGDLWLIFF